MALTGMGLPAEAGIWRRWYADEQDWLRRGAAEELRRLNSDDATEVVAALGVLGRHRLGGEQLAPRLAPLLQHREPMVVAQACRLLAGYRNLASVRPLLELLGSDDAGLRTEGWLALTAITGLALPEDESVWRRELPLELQ